MQEGTGRVQSTKVHECDCAKYSNEMQVCQVTRTPNDTNIHTTVERTHTEIRKLLDASVKQITISLCKRRSSLAQCI